MLLVIMTAAVDKVDKARVVYNDSFVAYRLMLLMCSGNIQHGHCPDVTKTNSLLLPCKPEVMDVHRDSTTQRAHTCQKTFLLELLGSAVWQAPQHISYLGEKTGSGLIACNVTNGQLPLSQDTFSSK